MATLQPAAVALDGGDPRLSNAGEGIVEYSRAALASLHNPNVMIEEYFHYAKITREAENDIPIAPMPFKKVLGFGKKEVVDVKGHVISENMPLTEGPGHTVNEKGAMDKSNTSSPAAITDEEWLTASRAARTATWAAVFYLITTDILGPFSVPWAFSQMGYGPGVILYTVFGALAGYTGWQIWQMFLSMDSDKYPLKTYGDIAFRIYGTFARHIINVLQSIQLLFNVGVIVIGNGNGLYQVNSNICYVVCCVIWCVCGMFLGQIRTLQKFGWIANFAIWLNVTVIIITLASVANMAPNYQAAAAQNGVAVGPPAPPVKTTGGSPDGVAFSGQVVGLMQAVYSYGGAMLFCEFMSEMRKPWDFWKALVVADGFIFIAYLFFGLFVYSFQGQYTVNPANQGISMQAVLTAGNIISFISALIAAALYGNIGIKVLYQNVFKELFGLPDLTTRTGKLLWIPLVPIYWGVAFVMAAAIPNFNSLSGLVAAVCIMQFTYTFPPLLYLGMLVSRDAVRTEQGEGYDATTGVTVRHDSGIKRWVRGFFAGSFLAKINKMWLVFFFLGALATCALGIYSSVEGLIAAFKDGRATAFSCVAPI